MSPLEVLVEPVTKKLTSTVSESPKLSTYPAYFTAGVGNVPSAPFDYDEDIGAEGLPNAVLPEAA